MVGDFNRAKVQTEQRYKACYDSWVDLASGDVFD
jgi:hypothetical protein